MREYVIHPAAKATGFLSQRLGKMLFSPFLVFAYLTISIDGHYILRNAYYDKSARRH
jgi:hypothetical protein